jgi:hypothetical protein
LLVIPAPLEDLRKAEAEWARLSALMSAKETLIYCSSRHDTCMGR